MREPLRERVNIRWENITVYRKHDLALFNLWKKPSKSNIIIKNGNKKS